MASQRRETSGNEAVRIYQEYIAQIAGGEPITFEDVLRRHPAHAEAIKTLHRTRELSSTGGSGGGIPAESYSAQFFKELGPSDEEMLFSTSGERGPPATPVDIDPSIRTGARLDRYELLEQIGAGGFGVVFRAVELGSRRIVAIKFLRAQDGDFVRRFEAETQALARMHHDCIVTVHAMGKTQAGRPYFVMEHIDGKPITAYCDQARLSIRSRVNLLIGVCRAVQHAHRQGFLHRDVKPQNILVYTTEAGAPRPKIIDFGLAKALQGGLIENPVVTQQSVRLGTPLYMSPEQLKGREVTASTDVYALGMVLYELLVGAPPFDLSKIRTVEALEGTEPTPPLARLQAVVRQSTDIAARRGTHLAALERVLRGDAAWIVMKAIEKDVQRRYETVGELARDLECYLDSRPVTARKPTLLYHARRFARRRPFFSGLAAAAAAACIALPFFAFASYQREREYSGLVSEVWGLLDEGRVSDAAHLAEFLGARFRGREEVEKVAIEVDRRRSAKEKLDFALGDVDRVWNDYLKTREMRAIHEAALEANKREASEDVDSTPIWERIDELKNSKALSEEQDRLDELYHAIQVALFNAQGLTPPSSEERHRIRELMASFFQRELEDAENRGGRTLSPRFFREMLRGVSAAPPPERLVVKLSSDPPGARVYCFRYEEHEARLLPLPWHPKNPLRAQPFLRVEHVNQGPWPLEPGDEVVAFGGVPVHAVTDWAREILRVEIGAKVAVQIRRGGSGRSVDVVPFPEGKPKRLTSLGPIRFEGYPLIFEGGDHLLGETPASGSLDLDFPAGSYLLVFRREGFADARVPILVGEREIHETVKLLPTQVVPDGFVYVPAGSVATGGDPAAFQSLPWGETPVAAFLMARCEVTFDEWGEFLNSAPAGQIDPETGLGKLQSAEAPTLLDPSAGGEAELVPKDNDGLLFEHCDGRWTLGEGLLGRHPVTCVSHVAALEYAEWRSARDGRRYCLPTDLEWERAARGVDRRAFVWGDYMVWTYCTSHRGTTRETEGYSSVGSTPTDESVFGIRDMNGNVSEHTSGGPVAALTNRTYRGGNWADYDELYFRLASRNTMVPDRSNAKTGLRLVIEIEDP